MKTPTSNGFWQTTIKSKVSEPLENFYIFYRTVWTVLRDPKHWKNTVQFSSTAEKISNRIDVTEKPLSKLLYEIQFLR